MQSYSIRWSITRTLSGWFEPRGAAYIRRQMRSATTRTFNETQSRTTVKSSDMRNLAIPTKRKRSPACFSCQTVRAAQWKTNAAPRNNLRGAHYDRLTV